MSPFDRAALQEAITALQKETIRQYLQQAAEPRWLPWVQAVGAALIGVAIGVYVP